MAARDRRRGAQRAALEALARALGLAERVVFTGFVDRPGSVLGELDVYVLTSDTEQMPIGVLEAMALGLPVLATDVGDLRLMLPPASRDACLFARATRKARSPRGWPPARSARRAAKIGRAEPGQGAPEFSLEPWWALRAPAARPDRGGMSRRPGHRVAVAHGRRVAGVRAGLQGERCRPDAHLLVCRRTNPDDTLAQLMRRLLLGAIPFVVLAAMLALRAWDPLPLQELRWLAFDTYQRLAPRTYDPAMPVKIVDLDDESLAAHRPVALAAHAGGDLLERLDAGGRRGDRLRHRLRRTGSQLARAGAQAVAEDPRGAGAARQRRGPALPRQHPRRGDRAGPGGHRLRPDQRRAGNAVAAGWFAAAERHEPGLEPLVARALGGRLDGEPGERSGRARAGEQGHLRRRRRRSGDVRPAVHQRRHEPGGAGGGATGQRRAQLDARRRPGDPARARGARPARPALSIACGRGAQGGPGRQTNVVKSSGASGVPAFGEHTGVSVVRIGEFEIPTDPKGACGCSSASTIRARYIPAWTVLEDDFDPDTVAGQIVFVGTSAAGLHDIRATPLDPSIPGSRSTPRRSSRSCPAISSSGRTSPTAWSWRTCWCSA